MSVVRAVTVGTLVGAVSALALYATVGPDDLGRVAVPVAPTFAPVPTPTVTRLADCTPPAVLKKGVCVTTKPRPKVPAPNLTSGAPTSAPRTAADSAVTDEEDEEHDDADDGADD